MDADAPIGFLLSGGLDSSLVCGISAKLSKRPLETFAIGMDVDAIDLKYAREVADFIGSNHHEVIITRDDVISALKTAYSSCDVIGLDICGEKKEEPTDEDLLINDQTNQKLLEICE